MNKLVTIRKKVIMLPIAKREPWISIYLKKEGVEIKQTKERDKKAYCSFPFQSNSLLLPDALSEAYNWNEGYLELESDGIHCLLLSDTKKPKKIEYKEVKEANPLPNLEDAHFDVLEIKNHCIRIPREYTITGDRVISICREDGTYILIQKEPCFRSETNTWKDLVARFGQGLNYLGMKNFKYAESSTETESCMRIPAAFLSGIRDKTKVRILYKEDWILILPMPEICEISGKIQDVTKEHMVEVYVGTEGMKQK